MANPREQENCISKKQQSKPNINTSFFFLAKTKQTTKQNETKQKHVKPIKALMFTLIKKYDSLEFT